MESTTDAPLGTARSQRRCALALTAREEEEKKGAGKRRSDDDAVIRTFSDGIGTQRDAPAD